jgi:molybdate transport system ATP-binding protein
MLTFYFRHAFRNRRKVSFLNGKCAGPVLQVAGTIGYGSVTGIKGPSGSGKTTLLRVLAGLQNPDRGRIVCGSTVWFDSAERIAAPTQKRNLAFVFQDYALFPDMTVRQNLSYGAKDNAFGEYCMEMLKLSALQSRYPGELSGGQKQRCALGRALAAQPRLLLMDEPLSALDDELRMELREELKALFGKVKCTGVIVSHSETDLNHLCSVVLPIDTLCRNALAMQGHSNSAKKLSPCHHGGVLVASSSVKIEGRRIGFVG